jgi:hypothetical protein
MTRVGLETELDSGRLIHVPLRRSRGPIYSELGLYARADTALPLAAELFAESIRDTMAANSDPDDTVSGSVRNGPTRQALT